MKKQLILNSTTFHRAMGLQSRWKPMKKLQKCRNLKNSMPTGTKRSLSVSQRQFPVERSTKFVSFNWNDWGEKKLIIVRNERDDCGVDVLNWQKENSYELATFIRDCFKSRVYKYIQSASKLQRSYDRALARGVTISKNCVHHHSPTIITARIIVAIILIIIFSRSTNFSNLGSSIISIIIVLIISMLLLLL